MKPEMRTKTCTLKNRDKSGLSGELSMTKHDPSDEATMNPRDMCSPETELENQIRTLQPVRQRLMFSELTEFFLIVPGRSSSMPLVDYASRSTSSLSHTDGTMK